jgi:hypothetical protein
LPPRTADPGENRAILASEPGPGRFTIEPGRFPLENLRRNSRISDASAFVKTAKLEVGRLLEIRIDVALRSAADVDELFVSIDQALAEVQPGQRHVTVADWRFCPLMSPEAAQRFAQRIAGYNARTERSAALARQDAPVTVLQFVRVIREAGLPDRKLFFSEGELVAWVSEVLTSEEQQRLRDFLQDGRASS